MAQKIIVYGHGDKRPVLGFPTAHDLELFIKDEIFTKNLSRYHYTKGADADVIVLSRGGLAYGHFEIDDKVKPNAKDEEDYPDVKFVYLVRSSALYSNPVSLWKELQIRVNQSGCVISEEEFERIKTLAGTIQEYHEPIGARG